MASHSSPRPPRLTAIGYRYAIVESSYHGEFVSPMAEAAADEIQQIEPLSQVRRVTSPGSFEIPVVVRGCLQTGQFDAVIALGLIWQGQTAHAQLIARAVTEGLMRLALDTGCPVIHEVLLVENEEQARARCLPGPQNRGVEAAHAALQSVRTLAALRDEPAAQPSTQLSAESAQLHPTK